MEEEIIIKACKLYKDVFKGSVNEILPLKLSGSARRYFRLKTDAGNMILCVSENLKENATFIRLCNYFLAKNQPVPRIYAVSDNIDSYLLEDLGNSDLLQHLLTSSRDNAERQRLIREVVDKLVIFQNLPEEEWLTLMEFPELGSDLIRYDFNYAKENFITILVPDINVERLGQEFEYLEERLLSYPRELRGLMFRDFQSRNIMLAPSPYFIDFQSSRKGPGIYDVVSFAWQAKAGFSKNEREYIIERYISGMESIKLMDCGEIKSHVKYWALFRMLQTLGAYGLRGLKEGKPHFIESIPPALKNITGLMKESGLGGKMPELFSSLLKALQKVENDGR